MELARVDASFCTFFGVHSGLAMGSIYLDGSEEQKQRWLPPMARWEKIGCFGLTEPLVGSGTSGGLTTTAKREGDTWTLNGQKRWIGNAVRGVILTGAGDKAFIAGADISELADATAIEAEQSSSFGQAVLNLIENLGNPVIAAINGFALGGGCETAMACTIRLATENARFGQPEVTLGLVPGGGGTQRLPRLVGKGRALQLILSGEMISAQEVYRIGLVNEVVPGSDLMTRAEAILKRISPT